MIAVHQHRHHKGKDDAKPKPKKSLGEVVPELAIRGGKSETKAIPTSTGEET